MMCRIFSALLGAVMLMGLPASAVASDLWILYQSGNCPQCDLRGVGLYGALLRRVDLHGADLSRAELDQADLYRADPISAKLVEAELNQANLSEADLTQADPTGAELSGARHADCSVLILRD